MQAGPLGNYMHANGSLLENTSKYKPVLLDSWCPLPANGHRPVPSNMGNDSSFAAGTQEGHDSERND
jgi:hypothetical protein